MVGSIYSNVLPTYYYIETIYLIVESKYKVGRKYVLQYRKYILEGRKHSSYEAYYNKKMFIINFDEITMNLIQ